MLTNVDFKLIYYQRINEKFSIKTKGTGISGIGDSFSFSY